MAEMKSLVKNFEHLRQKNRAQTEVSPGKLDGETVLRLKNESKVTGQDTERLRKYFIKDTEQLLDSVASMPDTTSIGPSTLENTESKQTDSSVERQKKIKTSRKGA